MSERWASSDIVAGLADGRGRVKRMCRRWNEASAYDRLKLTRAEIVDGAQSPVGTARAAIARAHDRRPRDQTVDPPAFAAEAVSFLRPLPPGDDARRPRRRLRRARAACFSSSTATRRAGIFPAAASSPARRPSEALGARTRRGGRHRARPARPSSSASTSTGTSRAATTSRCSSAATGGRRDAEGAQSRDRRLRLLRARRAARRTSPPARAGASPRSSTARRVGRLVSFDRRRGRDTSARLGA